MRKPLLLYSCNTWLAWAVADQYYKGIHYCWCSPFFDGRRAGGLIQLPPSASPAEICESLAAAVQRNDGHCAQIENNRIGIRRGAASKRAAGVITDDQLNEVEYSVKAADARDFRPLIFVIPYARVRGLVKGVAPAARAHPMSPEYLIESLPRRVFDVIQFGGWA